MRTQRLFMKLNLAIPAIAAAVGYLVIAAPSALMAQSAGQITSPDGWTWQNPLPQGNHLYGVWGSASRGANGLANDVFAAGAGGTILHYDGAAWSGLTSGTTNNLYAVWGSFSTNSNGRANDVYAVGAAGTILHYNGTGWITMSSGVTKDLCGVWGSSASDVYAVGAGGTILHYGGGAWMPLSAGGTAELRSVWGSSSTDVFVVGANTILHYNGAAWVFQPVTSGATPVLYAVWGYSSSDVYASGVSINGLAVVLHYNGSAWNVAGGAEAPALRAIWGDSAGWVWSVGPSVDPFGAILVTCSAGNCGPGYLDWPSTRHNDLYAIWGSSSADILIVGANGTILHWDGAHLAAMSSGTGLYSFQSISGSSPVNVLATGFDWSTYQSNNDRWMEQARGSTAYYYGGAWTDKGNGFLSALWFDPLSGVGYGVGPMGLGTWDGSQVNIRAPYNTPFYAVWGAPASTPGYAHIFAAGPGGIVVSSAPVALAGYIWNWNSLAPGVFYGIWGGASEYMKSASTTYGLEIVAVGRSGSCWDSVGGTTRQWTLSGAGDLNSVWGSALRDASGRVNDAFAVGVGGFIGHFDGVGWTQMTSPTTNTLYGVWGSLSTDASGHANDVYAVGDSGTILHYNGVAWTAMRSGTQNGLYGVWGSSANDVFVAGAYGTILHYQQNTPVNPTPVLTGISPASMPYAPGGSYTITINGRSFVLGASVRINGLSLLTTYVSGAQLTAKIPAENLPQVGTPAAITVFNPGTGPSNPMTFATVQAAPSLSVSVSGSPAYGATVTLTATLTAGGLGVPNEKITFSLGAPASGGTAIGALAPDVPTGPNGVAAWSATLPTSANAGIYPLTAAFAGDANYAAASASGSLTISQLPTSLFLQSASGYYRGTVSLTARLTSLGSSLSGQSVSFSLNQTGVGSATTDPDGFATLPGVSLAGLSAGTYTISASFARPNYSASSATAPLYVNAAPTVTTLTPKNITIAYPKLSTYVTLTATVTSLGNPVNEGAVWLPTDPTNSGLLVPVVNGQARATYTVPAGTSGPLPITAEFNVAPYPPGAQFVDLNLQASFDTGQITIGPLTAALSIGPLRIEPSTLRVVISNSGPDPAPRATVTFGWTSPDGTHHQIGAVPTATIQAGGKTTSAITFEAQGLPPNSTLWASVTDAVALDPLAADNYTSVHLSALYYTWGAPGLFSVGRDGYSFSNQGTDVNWSVFEDTFGASNVDHWFLGFKYTDSIASMFYDNIWHKWILAGNCYGMAANSLNFWGAPVATHSLTTTYSRDEQQPWRSILKLTGTALGYQAMYQEVTHFGDDPTTTLQVLKADMRGPSGGSSTDPAILILLNPASLQGHAVVPYEIVQTPAAADIYVYDPNYPDDIDLAVHVNLSTNAWTYDTGGTPNWGGTWGLLLVPSSANAVRPTLPYLNFGDAYGLYFDYVNGAAHLGITNSIGQALGYVGQTFAVAVSKFGMSLMAAADSAAGSSFPEAYVTLPGPHVTTLSGTGTGTATAGLLRSNTALTFASQNMTPTTKDDIIFSQDGNAATLSTNAASEHYSAALIRNLGPTSERKYTVKNTSMAAGETIGLAIDNSGGGFRISNQGSSKTYDSTLEQVGEGQGQISFVSMSIGANETHTFTPTDWTHLDSAPVNLQIQNSQGTTSGNITAPAITSAASASFTYGTPGTFTLTATGFPRPLLSETGTLPGGVSFDRSTGVLSGAPTSVGSYNITFAATNSVGPAATQSFTLTVNPAPSSTVVTSSATPSILGQPVTFTATVSAAPPGSGAPTGAVTFKDGSTTLGTGTLTSGQATFGTSKLSVGSHSISAQYSGDANFIAGSGTVAQQVGYKICALYDQTKAVQSGSTVPIKLYLCDTDGSDVSSPSIVLHATQVVFVSGVAGTAESPGNANPDNDFVFDSTLGTSGGYHFNLKTTGLATGTYSLFFTVTNDPVIHSVNFGVK